MLKSWLLLLVRPFVSVSVLSSQGIGPLNTPWARKRLVGSFKNLDILSFRDFSNSKALVEAEGLTGVPYQIVADEAFSFPIASREEISQVLKAADISEGEPFIIANFRNTDFTQSTTFLLNKISELLDRVITETNKKVLFIPMSKGENYGRDHEAGLSLKGLMRHGERFFVLDPTDHIELVKGIIGAAAYSIGISYHMHVFSLAQGHPALIIYTGDYYKTKSDGLISFYGPPNRTVDCSEASVEKILAYVIEIDKHYSEACAHVSAVNEGVLENNDWTIKTLKRVLIEKGLFKTGGIIEISRVNLVFSG